MKQKIVRRASALVLAGCLLAGAALPALAASAKEEVIYANLDASGTVTGVYAVNSFAVQAGDTVTDHGSYTAVRNMTTTDPLEHSGDTITATVAEDGKKITITNNGEDSVLEKVDNPTFVPSAPENPQIDEKLVGAWDSGTGLYYYFGEDGRMYCNSYGTTFTYFTYNTKLNKVTAVYDMDGEQTDTYDYTFDGNDLVFDGMKYTQITPEKMLSAIQSY